MGHGGLMERSSYKHAVQNGLGLAKTHFFAYNPKTPPKQGCIENGADDGVRTRDPDLGKVVLYQLSHVRMG